MAETSEIRKIQCPQCAAPISLYGGKDVLTLVCSHCGSCLDSQDEFKFLKKFKSIERPNVPLKIGMTGVIQNISFVIIGIVEFTQRDEWGSYPWVEFLLFSKTHGYAWLCYENGHYVFGREVKDVPVGPTITFDEPVFTTKLHVKNKRFRVFERALASITYVEGELTWRAGTGDNIKYLDAVSPPYMYSAEKNSTEMEYFFGEYVSPQEVYKSFGIADKAKEPEGIFSCQPFSCFPLLKGLADAGTIFSVITGILLFIVLFFYQGKVIFSQNVQTSAGQESEYTFTVTQPQGLMAMDIYSPLSNAWANFDINIIDNDDNEVYAFAKTIDYYHGYEGGESWSEGTQSAKAYFKVPEAGSYRFILAAEGGTDEWSDGTQNISAKVTLRQGVRVSRYLWLTFLFMLGCAVTPRLWFAREQWKDYYEEVYERHFDNDDD